MDRLDRIEQTLVRIEEKVDRMKVDKGFELKNGIYVPKEKGEVEFWDCLAQKEYMNEMYMSQVQQSAFPVKVKYRPGMKRTSVVRAVQPKKLKRNKE